MIQDSRWKQSLCWLIEYRNGKDSYSDPRYCIAAHVPAIKAPGLTKVKLVRHSLSPSVVICTYREPDRLGLAYTPPEENIS